MIILIMYDYSASIQSALVMIHLPITKHMACLTASREICRSQLFRSAVCSLFCNSRWLHIVPCCFR